MTNIADNLRRVTAAIEHFVTRCGRTADQIKLLAASKGQDADAIATAWHEGIRCFGENYLQEALVKMDTLRGLGIEWHYIGSIQENKTRAIAAHFTWVHSVDRLRIATRLSAQRPPDQPPLNICIQVNIDAEASKAGVAPAQLAELALAVADLPRVHLRGLMAIPRPANSQPADSQDGARAAYRRLAQLLAELRALSPRLAGLDTLSMGMSADMEAAIAEGATIVRIGTAVFGPRHTATTTSPRSKP